MPLQTRSWEYRHLTGIHLAAWRMGLYLGVCLSLVLTAWLVVANRVPVLERFAWERNLAGATALGLFAAIPVVRFIRSPGRLLFSGLIAWTILSLSYRANCLYFSGLSTRMGAFHVFMLGCVLYLLAAVISWVAILLWHIRDSHARDSANRLS
jgi:hypothetical protein